MPIRACPIFIYFGSLYLNELIRNEFAKKIFYLIKPQQLNIKFQYLYDCKIIAISLRNTASCAEQNHLRRPSCRSFPREGDARQGKQTYSSQLSHSAPYQLSHTQGCE
jgi:hypothetical protein